MNKRFVHYVGPDDPGNKAGRFGLRCYVDAIDVWHASSEHVLPGETATLSLVTCGNCKCAIMAWAVSESGVWPPEGFE